MTAPSLNWKNLNQFMNMDHMFIMRLAALLFGGGIASCLFPGKSRMSHVLFLLLVLAETAVAHATIPDGWWFLLPGVVSVLLRLSFKGGTESGKGGKALLSLHATDGTIIRYYYWFSNFLVYGGAGSGKTKSIGKPLMEQYIRSGFAGFIYDFKDFDYTRTAYNLIRKHGYPHEFYYVNFTDMNRTYRFNPLDRRNIKDRTMLMQLMEDVLGALMPPTSKQDEWYTGALGILNGVAYRLWDEFPECCTLPHIVNFVMKADTGQLQEFLKLNDISAMVMSIASRSFSMENRVPFVFILDEMTTFKVRDFEKLPSVLREYGAAFLLLTQSEGKLEKLYSKLDRSSIEANFGNIFLGCTQDVEALKYYPLFFGKYEKEKKSTSSGSSGGGRNSSVTISTQKEEIYESKDFASLEPGEFIGMGNRSNIKGHFRKKFRLFELKEEPLPVVAFRTEKEISDNYTRILKDIERVLGMEDAEVDVNSLFIGK
ncbi:hypothetical protein I100019A1_33690 [Phocaeicola vulgatus]